MREGDTRTDSADAQIKSQYFDLLRYKNCKPKTVSDSDEREKLQEALEDQYQKELERNREHRFSKDAVRMKKMSKKLKKGSRGDGSRDSRRDSKRKRHDSDSDGSKAAEELPFFMMDASIRAAMKEKKEREKEEKQKKKRKRERRHKHHEKKSHSRKRRDESSASSDSESSDDSSKAKSRKRTIRESRRDSRSRRSPS